MKSSDGFPESITDWNSLAGAMDFFISLEKPEKREKRAEEWVFRGVNDGTEDKSLRTTLDRVAKEFDICGRDIKRLEEDLLLEFQRRYHHYSVEPAPAKGDVLDWLALMQHYGAPTRLLDFSYSLLVAAFFALERRAEKPEAIPAIWAINKSWLSNKVPPLINSHKDLKKPFKKYLKERDGEGFERVFLKKGIQFVYPVGSFRMNQRLTIQQGLFLCPGDVKTTFDKNLRSLDNDKANVKRIQIDPAARPDLLKAINRANMNAATLSPGLDGFARSLWTKAASLRQLRHMQDRGARISVNLDAESIRKH